MVEAEDGEVIPGFEDGRGLWIKKCGCLLGDEKDKEADSFLGPPGEAGLPPWWRLDFSPMRSILNFQSPELSDNDFILF